MYAHTPTISDKMPDSRKITIKTKVTINTISDDVDARDNAARHQSSPHSSLSPNEDVNRSSLNDDEGSGSRRHSSKRQSRAKKVSNAGSSNVESISLQESNELRPVQLKASFLRRKMKEYEGNEISPSGDKLFIFASLSFGFDSC